MESDTEDLLHIPSFLRRGTPESNAFLARGAEILASQPKEDVKKNPPDPRTQDPTKSQAAALEKLGWMWYHVRRLNRFEAGVMIECKLGPEARFTSKSRTWGSEKESE